MKSNIFTHLGKHYNVTDWQILQFKNVMIYLNACMQICQSTEKLQIKNLDVGSLVALFFTDWTNLDVYGLVHTGLELV